ncbi:ParB family protein [Microbacterium sp. bgisy207]|uniref:ParB family protein n=1 Tax=Microbacterium sp. bgisy207 TaxID=3413800 RepID=UPI003EC0B961
MSARPERKRSTLSGRNPIAPAAETPREPPAAAPAPAAPATPAESVTEPQAAAPKKRSKYPPKVSFYQEQEDTDRIRGAIMHTIPYEGVRSLSQFLSGAAMKEVERLERQYNDGKPFPPVGARELPQGRPMGE